jgi:hypothetical protein
MQFTMRSEIVSESLQFLKRVATIDESISLKHRLTTGCMMTTVNSLLMCQCLQTSRPELTKPEPPRPAHVAMSSLVSRAKNILDEAENLPPKGDRRPIQLPKTNLLTAQQRISRWGVLVRKIELVLRTLATIHKVELTCGKQIVNDLFVPEFRSQTASSSSTTEEPLRVRVIQNEIVGEPLPRLKSTVKAKIEHWINVEDCRHPTSDMLRGGNRSGDKASRRSQWWVCKLCGGRWARREINQTSSEATGQTRITFGKYNGYTYDWLMRNQGAYCQWVMLTWRHDESVSPCLAKLARWLNAQVIKMTTQETVEQAEAEDVEIISSDDDFSAKEETSQSADLPDWMSQWTMGAPVFDLTREDPSL